MNMIPYDLPVEALSRKNDFPVSGSCGSVYTGKRAADRLKDKSFNRVLWLSLPSGSDFAAQNHPQFRKIGSFRYAKAMVIKMTEIKINEHQTALVEFYDENCNQKWYTGTIDGKNGFLTEYRNPRIRYTAVQYGEHAENLKYGGSNVIVNFHGFVNRFDETTVPPVMLPNVLFDETIKLENIL